MKNPRKPKGTPPVKQAWVPDPKDAINLAALRWYALTIDRLCIEIYATNRKKFRELETLLQSQVKALYGFAKDVGLRDDDQCPPGYMMCPDRLCAPSCDFE
jgi:hypothetical protein